jgi:hypothetical protein
VRLLLVWNSPATMVNLAAVFAGNISAVTRCAESSQAIAELRKSGGRYDWVILESRGLIEEDGEIVTAIEAVGLQVPIGYLNAEEGVKPSLSLICAAQRSAAGIHFLRCALSRPGAARIDIQNHGGDEIILEYHAHSQMDGNLSTPVLTIRKTAPVPDTHGLNAACLAAPGQAPPAGE